MRRMITLLIALCCLCVLLPPQFARAEEGTAQDLTASTAVSGWGYGSFSFLFDKNEKYYQTSAGDTSITLQNDAGIGALYLLFDLEFGSYSVTDLDTGAVHTAGTTGMLHEVVDLVAAFSHAPKGVTLSFNGGNVRLSEIYVFGEGALPSFVQRWDAPLEKGADILLLSTHGDDDQLFFAGLLPLYAGEKNLRVQVVYMTDHRNSTNARTHEMLNGLWAVGVKVYPVFGRFADFRIDSLEGTYDKYASMGVSREEICGFVAEQLRRFKPQVVVGHDIAGEYGHGMHMVYTDALIKALAISADPAAFPESAEHYGLWEVPKTYLHLYQENPIVIDYDQPLESFGGLTAFQVTQRYGFPCHESQQWTWFRTWLNGSAGEITAASQINTLSPCQFGLYHSTVGEDVRKNDFMENTISYAEQERLEQERLEQERLEQERLEQERLEQERLEQERLEQERLEQERLEQERLEQLRLEQERLAREQAQKEKRRQLLIAGGILAVLVLLLVIVVTVLAKRMGKKKVS